MKLEVGKKYLTRSGHTAEILTYIPKHKKDVLPYFPYAGLLQIEDGQTFIYKWGEEGEALAPGGYHPYDLILEFDDPIFR